MTKEVKSLFLVSITLILYSVSIFISSGSIIFPFPLNPFIFLAITIQFAIWHSKAKMPWMIILFVAIAACLSSIIVWEIILPSAQLNSFVSSAWIDFFKIAQGIGILTWGISIARKQDHLKYSFLTVIGLSLVIIGHFQGFNVVELLGLGLITLSTHLNKVYSPFHLLWLLLFVLKLSHVLSLLLN